MPLIHEDVIDGQDYFVDEELDGSRQPNHDPLSAAIGSNSYVESYVIDDCVEKFPNDLWLPAERFDRYYWHAPAGPDGTENPITPILIDLIGADAGPERARQEDEKRVAFKRAWCAENDWRYVVLYDTDEEPYEVQIAQALAEPTDDESEKPAPRPRAKQQRQRGGVQRPKANQA
jgi:hypothetical protein